MHAIRVELHAYWHAGTGMGDGPGADGLVIKDRSGLPYLPGRTLKGLLREGLELAEEVRQLKKGTVSALMGDDGTGADSGLRRLESREGALWLSNARLGRTPEQTERWRAWARSNGEKVAHLYDAMAATAIDEDGVIRKRSLRTLEVAVPLTLWASVGCEPEIDGWQEALQVGAALVRALGTRRNRGLGRCSLALEEVA